MIDKNGTKLTRGTRVLVEFPEIGMSWTGRVVGASGGLTDRVRVKGEYVSWKPARHLSPESLTRMPDQSAPVHYEDDRQILSPLTHGLVRKAGAAAPTNTELNAYVDGQLVSVKA